LAPTDEEIAAATKFPAGYVHLPRGSDAEWVKQLVAEPLVTIKTKRGLQRLEWQKLRERNEALDCRVYARAAAWIAHVAQSRTAGCLPEVLEESQVQEPAAISVSIAGVLQRRPEQRSRRVFRSSYMS
jgi:phage terminase large subunit GpA-like protein